MTPRQGLRRPWVPSQAHPTLPVSEFVPMVMLLEMGVIWGAWGTLGRSILAATISWCWWLEEEGSDGDREVVRRRGGNSDSFHRRRHWYILGAGVQEKAVTNAR